MEFWGEEKVFGFFGCQCVRGKTVTQSLGLTDEFMCSNKLIHGPYADITLVGRINSGFILWQIDGEIIHLWKESFFLLIFNSYPFTVCRFYFHLLTRLWTIEFFDDFV